MWILTEEQKSNLALLTIDRIMMNVLVYMGLVQKWEGETLVKWGRVDLSET